jgi:hypothetical protein
LGVVVAAVGVFIVLQAVGVIPAGRMNAPRWVGVLAGLVFGLGGLAVILGAIGGAKPNGDLPASAPLWIRVAVYLLGLTIFASFAIIGSWIAFGPGTRSFGTNVPFLQSGTANEIGGRIAFGFGAVLVWLCTLGYAFAGFRKLVKRRDA